MSNSLFQEDEASIEQLVQLQQQAAQIDLTEALSGEEEGEEEFSGSEENFSDNDHLPVGNVLESIPFTASREEAPPIGKNIEQTISSMGQEPPQQVPPKPVLTETNELPNLDEPKIIIKTVAPPASRPPAGGAAKPKPLVTRPPAPNRGGVIRPPVPPRPSAQKPEASVEPVGLLDDNLSEIKSTSSSPQPVKQQESTPSHQGKTTDPFLSNMELQQLQSSLSPNHQQVGLGGGVSPRIGQDSEMLFNEGLFQFKAIDAGEDRILAGLAEGEDRGVGVDRDGANLVGIGGEEALGIGIEERHVGLVQDGSRGQARVIPDEGGLFGAEDRLPKLDNKHSEGFGDRIQIEGVQERLNQDTKHPAISEFEDGDDLGPKIGADGEFCERFQYPGGDQMVISRIATRIEADSPMNRLGSEPKVRTKVFEVDHVDQIREVNEEQTRDGIFRNESIVERVEIPDYEPSPIMAIPTQSQDMFSLKPAHVGNSSVSPLLHLELSKILNLQTARSSAVPDLFTFVADLIQENRSLKDRVLSLETELNQARSQLDFIPKLQSELEESKTRAFEVEAELTNAKAEVQSLQLRLDQSRGLETDISSKLAAVESGYEEKLQVTLSQLDTLKERYQNTLSHVEQYKAKQQAADREARSQLKPKDPQLQAAKSDLLSKLDQLTKSLSSFEKTEAQKSLDLGAVIGQLQKAVLEDPVKKALAARSSPEANQELQDPQIKELALELISLRAKSLASNSSILSVANSKPTSKLAIPDLSVVKQLSQLIGDSEKQRVESLEALRTLSTGSLAQDSLGISVDVELPKLDELFPIYQNPGVDHKIDVSNQETVERPVLLTKKSDITANKTSPDESSLSVSRVQIKERDSDQLTENPKSEKMVSPLLGRRNIILFGEKPTASRSIPFNLDPRTPAQRTHLKQMQNHIANQNESTQRTEDQTANTSGQPKRFINKFGARGLFSKAPAASERKLPLSGPEVPDSEVSRTQQALNQIDSQGLISTNPYLQTQSDFLDQETTPCSVMNHNQLNFEKAGYHPALVEEQIEGDSGDNGTDNDSNPENPDLLDGCEGGKMLTIKDNLSMASEMTPKGIGSITPLHIRRARNNDARTIPFENPADNNFEKAKQMLMNRYTAAPKDSTDSSPRSAINDKREVRALSFDVNLVPDAKAPRKSSHDPLSPSESMSPPRVMVSNNTGAKKKASSQLYLIPEAQEPVPANSTTSHGNLGIELESDDETDPKHLTESPESKPEDNLPLKTSLREVDDLQEELSSSPDLMDSGSRTEPFQEDKTTSLLADDEIHFSDPKQPELVETSEKPMDLRVETAAKGQSGSLSRSRSNSLHLHEDTPVPISIGETPSNRHTSHQNLRSHQNSFPEADQTQNPKSMAEVAQEVPEEEPAVKVVAPRPAPPKQADKPIIKPKPFVKPPLKKPPTQKEVFQPLPVQEVKETDGVFNVGSREELNTENDQTKLPQGTPEFESQPLKSKPAPGLLKKPVSFIKNKTVTKETPAPEVKPAAILVETPVAPAEDQIIQDAELQGSPQKTSEVGISETQLGQQEDNAAFAIKPDTRVKPVLLTHMSSDLWEIDKESPKFVNLEFGLKELPQTPLSKDDAPSPMMGLIKKRRTITKGMSFGTAEVDDLLGDTPTISPEQAHNRLAEINEVHSSGSPVNDGYGEDSPQKNQNSRFIIIGRRDREDSTPASENLMQSAPLDHQPSVGLDLQKFASAGHVEQKQTPLQDDDDFDLEQLDPSPPKVVVSPPKIAGPPKGKIAQVPRAPFKRPNPIPANPFLQKPKTIVTSNDIDEDDLTRQKPRRQDSMDEVFKNSNAKLVLGLDDEIIEDLNTLALPQSKSPPRNSQSLQVDEGVSREDPRPKLLKGTISMSAFNMVPTAALASSAEKPEPKTQPTKLVDDDDDLADVLAETPTLKPPTATLMQEDTPEVKKDEDEAEPETKKTPTVVSPPKPGLAIKKPAFKQTKLVKKN